MSTVEMKPSAKQKEWLTPELLHSAPSAKFGVLKGKKYAQLGHPKGGPLTCVFCPRNINAMGVKKIDGKWHWDISD